MRRLLIAVALATTTIAGAAAPAAAQSYADQQRWSAAQSRYRAETQRYEQERDRYYSLRGGGYDRDDAYGDGSAGYYDDQYGGGYRQAPAPGYGGYADDRYENGYDASRYYRGSPRYQERTLAANDRVYRGNDGRYYCRRSDGTTGLIIGAAGGGILGNVIDGGHSRAAGTLIGGALGALVGRSVDQNQSIRCR